VAYSCRKKLKSDMSRRYGLSLKAYEALLKGADYSCMICGKHQDEGAVLCVEHCSETGKTRGISCTLCNTAISYMNHDVEILKNAIEYLEDS